MAPSFVGSLFTSFYGIRHLSQFEHFKGGEKND